MTQRNIVLVGFMGTGKTSAGQILSQQTGMPLLDMDTVIEERAGKPISSIFADEGEAVFREKEHALAAELSEPTGRIVSTGGGIVLNPDNIRLLAQGGLVVCLNASVDEILRRVGNDASRPLLQTVDKRRKVTDLLAARAHLYASIPVQIDTDGLSSQEVAQQILKRYQEGA